MDVKGLLGLIFLFYCSCEPKQEWDTPAFPYDFEALNNPTLLEHQLDEISGLCFFQDSTLLAINDEEGVIFKLSSPNYKSKAWIDFKKNGDFEGIASLGQEIFVLESNGDLFQVQTNGEYKRFNLFKKGYDFEGLCLNNKQSSLLIACKKHKSKQKDESIWVFEFDLKDMKLKSKPFLQLSKKELPPHFRPSGIAMNPKGELFVISATANSILELDRKGKVIRLQSFSELEFPQIEGICFNHKNDLLIASERDYLERAKLYYFARND